MRRIERIERCWLSEFLVFADYMIISHCFMHLEKSPGLFCENFKQF